VDVVPLAACLRAAHPGEMGQLPGNVCLGSAGMAAPAGPRPQTGRPPDRSPVPEPPWAAPRLAADVHARHPRGDVRSREDMP